MLTNADIAELTALRRELHRFPDVSREEGPTAARIVAALAPLSPDQLLTGLGGHGVAAVFQGAAPGRLSSSGPSLTPCRSRNSATPPTVPPFRARGISAAMTAI